MRKTNNNKKMGKVICQNCEIEFEKPLTEIRRSKKLGRRHFCSRQCVGYYSAKWHNPDAYRYNITKHSGWRRDEYTMFRYHYRNINKRTKEVNITIEDLRDVWYEQEGICPFTGVKLISSTYKKINDDILYSASLDRIDSSKGYIKGNIRWVSRGINYLKSDKSDEKVWEMCKMIYENYKNKKGEI